MRFQPFDYLRSRSEPAMIEPMAAPNEILRLVKQFDDNAEAYCSAGYNETQARIEFIDPFCKCLGWDIDNRQGFAEAYKDVIHEDAIKIGGVTKARDYCAAWAGRENYFWMNQIQGDLGHE